MRLLILWLLSLPVLSPLCLDFLLFRIWAFSLFTVDWLLLGFVVPRSLLLLLLILFPGPVPILTLSALVICCIRRET